MRRAVFLAAVATFALVGTIRAATPIHSMAELKKSRVQAVIGAPGFPDWITAGLGYVWLGNGHSIERIARIALPDTAPDGEGYITADATSVWVPVTQSNGIDGGIVRVDPKTNSVVATVKLPLDSSGAAAGFAAVWVTSAATSTVDRIDPATNAVTSRVKVHTSPRFLAAGEGGVWSLNQGDGSVSHIDPASGRVVATSRRRCPGAGDASRPAASVSG